MRSAQGKFPDSYYDYMRGTITREMLFDHPSLKDQAANARAEAWNMTLSLENHAEVTKRVKSALGDSDLWILIGGPPCQAYSLVGRSRMLSGGVKKFEADSRHFLYREYLGILTDHAPPIFIMENVKGLLSATHGGQSMLARSWMTCPDQLAVAQSIGSSRWGELRVCSRPSRRDYVVRSEQHGVPQARHRVILCGIREDVWGTPTPLTREDTRTVESALVGLPRIRSAACPARRTHTSLG